MRLNKIRVKGSRMPTAWFAYFILSLSFPSSSLLSQLLTTLLLVQLTCTTLSLSFVPHHTPSCLHPSSLHPSFLYPPFICPSSHSLLPSSPFPSSFLPSSLPIIRSSHTAECLWFLSVRPNHRNNRTLRGGKNFPAVSIKRTDVLR